MFLANLSDTQGSAFLTLARAMMSADGVVSADETAMMEQYRHEMNGSAVQEDTAQTPEQAVEVFRTAAVSIRKQIFFELVALAHADGEYADEERGLMERLAAMIGLDSAFLEDCRTAVEEVNLLYGRIARLISE